MAGVKVTVLTNSLKLTMFSDSGVLGGGVPQPGTGHGSGWIYFQDVIVPGGTASGKTWHDPPNNTILDVVTVSALAFDVQVRASYPNVEVNGIAATLALNVIGGFYEGVVSVTLAVAQDIVATALTSDGDPGATDTMAVNISLPPQVQSAVFTGAYPTGPGGLQTEVKENDTFQLQVTADKAFDQVVLSDFGASQATAIVVPTGTSATISVPIADRGTAAQLLGARLQIRDATTAALSPTFDTDSAGVVDGVNVVNLNNRFPAGAISGIIYPATQAAIKGVEPATVNHTATDFDSVVYSDPTTAQIDIANPNTFEAAKGIIGQAAGIFNNSVINFSYLLTRNANGAQTTVDDVVVVADVAPVIDLSVPAARLRSGGNNGTAVQNHTVTLVSNQPLLSTPTLDPDGGGNRGVFAGAFAGGPSTWTRQLQVSELVPDEKGTFTFASLVATGLAGIQQTVINSGDQYTLGGFVARSLTFAAFAITTSIGTSVEDFSKLQAGIFTSTNQTALKQSIGTGPPVIDGYTINATGVNPTDLIWLDTAAAGANSGGTAQITNVEEVV